MSNVDNTCDWAKKNELERHYHDSEWGKAVYDDRTLFEFITLEGAQAGLSWLVVLKKREQYRLAFDDYDLNILSKHDENRTLEIIDNFDVIKHKGKINSVFSNARAAIALQQEYGSLSKALWQFVDDEPVINKWASMDEVPTSTEVSRRMSKFLKKNGFKFVGETICYSFMQAMGMVNDHLVDCPKR